MPYLPDLYSKAPSKQQFCTLFSAIATKSRWSYVCCGKNGLRVIGLVHRLCLYILGVFGCGDPADPIIVHAEMLKLLRYGESQGYLTESNVQNALKLMKSQITQNKYKPPPIVAEAITLLVNSAQQTDRTTVLVSLQDALLSYARLYQTRLQFGCCQKKRKLNLPEPKHFGDSYLERARRNKNQPALFLQYCQRAVDLRNPSSEFQQKVRACVLEIHPTKEKELQLQQLLLVSLDANKPSEPAKRSISSNRLKAVAQLTATLGSYFKDYDLAELQSEEKMKPKVQEWHTKKEYYKVIVYHEFFQFPWCKDFYFSACINGGREETLKIKKVSAALMPNMPDKFAEMAVKCYSSLIAFRNPVLVTEELITKTLLISMATAYQFARQIEQSVELPARLAELVPSKATFIHDTFVEYWENNDNELLISYYKKIGIVALTKKQAEHYLKILINKGTYESDQYSANKVYFNRTHLIMKHVDKALEYWTEAQTVALSKYLGEYCNQPWHSKMLEFKTLKMEPVKPVTEEPTSSSSQTHKRSRSTLFRPPPNHFINRQTSDDHF